MSGSVGAGHDGVARELAARLSADGVEVSVLDHLAFLPGFAQLVLRDGYTATVNQVPALFEWIFQRLEDSRLMLAAADVLWGVAGRRLAPVLAGADVVVSTYPLASRSIGQLVDGGRLNVSTVTYLTDPSPHRTWVHPSIDVHLTVTAATAAAGERTYGVPMFAAGPLVPAEFSAPVSRLQRHRLRVELGLAPDRRRGPAELRVPGSGRARRRCGRNAGGLSLTEALAAGLPAVTYAPIPGHGRACAKVLHDSGPVPWASDTDQLALLLHQAAARRRTPLPVPALPAAEAVGRLAWRHWERRSRGPAPITQAAV